MVSQRLLLTVFAPCLFLAAGAAAGEAVSPWAVEGAARVRLVAGVPAADGSLRAGLEIRLDPSWKTYWLNPGPTGLPPRLDFSGSANLAKAEPLWPAPVRFDDGGSASVGYSGAFIVPLRVEALETGKPIRLKAVLDYGLCENICIPARAEVSLEFAPDEEPDAAAAGQIKAFEARVPKPAVMGDKTPLAVTGAGRTMAGLEIDVRFPEGAAVTDLFASSPGTSVGVPQRLQSGAYRIKLKSGPNPKQVDIVAVADGQAILVPLALDDLPLRH
jgi:DsbC/DsbD-like thiol-disulfide interchange protein